MLPSTEIGDIFCLDWGSLGRDSPSKPGINGKHVCNMDYMNNKMNPLLGSRRKSKKVTPWFSTDNSLVFATCCVSSNTFWFLFVARGLCNSIGILSLCQFILWNCIRPMSVIISVPWYLSSKLYSPLLTCRQPSSDQLLCGGDHVLATMPAEKKILTISLLKKRSFLVAVAYLEPEDLRPPGPQHPV